MPLVHSEFPYIWILIFFFYQCIQSKILFERCKTIPFHVLDAAHSWEEKETTKNHGILLKFRWEERLGRRPRLWAAVRVCGGWPLNNRQRTIQPPASGIASARAAVGRSTTAGGGYNHRLAAWRVAGSVGYFHGRINYKDIEPYMSAFL